MSINAGKRILAIHDLSGFGHTSLMAVIPIYYRLGIRVCALPTAVLSANTDYPDPCWVDMSAHIKPFAHYWKGLGLSFAAIHSGFLASAEQANLVAEAICELRQEQTTVLVDPVMADAGKLYSCFDASIIPAMRTLVAKADVITPNFTEAALLANRDPSIKASHEQIKEWCKKISSTGPRHVVITSVPGSTELLLETLHFDAEQDSLSSYPYHHVSGSHPGAGDCFAAFFLAGIVNGIGIDASIHAAVDILNRSLAVTIPENTDPREGIPLEEVMQWDLHSFYR